jgi:tungstate transport system substrate-binding protein
MRGRRSICAAFALVIASLLLPDGGNAAERRPLRIATTMSLHESGLLGALLPGFSDRSGYPIRVVAGPRDAVLEKGRRGEVDLVRVPALDGEPLGRDELFRSRTPLLESRMVLVGPKEDPAGVASAKSPEDAIARIARLRPPFVSRADGSDTHAREKALFRAAGIDPAARWPGHVRTESGMRASLEVAGQQRAYILSELAAFLAVRDRIGLVVLSKPAPSLTEVYWIFQVDPTPFDRPIEIEGAKALERDLLSPEVQKQIAGFGVDRFGEPVFEIPVDSTR